MPRWQHHAAHAFVGAACIKNSVAGKYRGPWWPQCCCRSPHKLSLPQRYTQGRGQLHKMSETIFVLCSPGSAFLRVNRPHVSFCSGEPLLRLTERKNSRQGTRWHWQWTNRAHVDDIITVSIVELVFSCFLVIGNFCDLNKKMFTWFLWSWWKQNVKQIYLFTYSTTELC